MKSGSIRASVSFLLIWLSACLLIYLTDNYFLTPQFFDRNGQLPFQLHGDSYRIFSNLQQWGYLYEGLYILLKITATSIVLGAGLYFAKITASFRKVFSVVTLAEGVFILYGAAKLAWFYFYKHDATLLEWHQTYLLSVLSLFPQAPADWYYPLQTLNAFEVFYWFMLAYGISKIAPLNFDNSLKVVVRSYVPALVIWVACALFASLLMYPAQG